MHTAVFPALKHETFLLISLVGPNEHIIGALGVRME